jgi:hypothetical protein
MNSVKARCSEASPNRMSLERHSSFTERTQRSANAFKFGLRAGSVRHCVPPDRSTSSKALQNFVSRSCTRSRRRLLVAAGEEAFRRIFTLAESPNCAQANIR